MQWTIQSTLKLNNGIEIPRFGLGVFRTAAGKEAKQAVLHALKAGYRHIDTAKIYGNEKDVGEAIRESGIPRKDIFVTTKLWNGDQGYDAAMKAFENSLSLLGLDVLDLYLIHWPVQHLRKDSWRALVEIQKQKRCRAIGVSNYTVRHLKELMSDSAVVPAVNQVELSPFLTQPELVRFCAEQGIAVEAYSPLTRGFKLSHPVIVRIAGQHQKTSAQVMIRWALQRDFIVIPKSSNPARIEENAAVFDFELSPSEMATLDGLNENLRKSWDPTDAP